MINPKTCIFCGKGKLSKQHVFPDWIKKVIPRINTKHHQLLGVTDVRKDHVFYQPNIRFHNGDLGSRKIKNVCEKCNNEWMSNIEVRVKPFLSNMILGKTETLSVDQQKDLVRWIVMTCIMAEFTDTAFMAIPQSDRDLLLNGGVATKSWLIWIGRYETQLDSLAYHHTGAQMNLIHTLRKEVNTQSSTMIIGQFYIHAMSGPSFLLPIYEAAAGAFTDKLIRIWPQNLAEITWPRYLKVSEDDSATIRNLLLRTGRFAVS